MASKQDSRTKQSASPSGEQKHQQSAAGKAVAAAKGASDDTQALDSLLETLDGDLTAIDTKAALGAIDSSHC